MHHVDSNSEANKCDEQSYNLPCSMETNNGPALYDVDERGAEGKEDGEAKCHQGAVDCDKGLEVLGFMVEATVGL